EEPIVEEEPIIEEPVVVEEPIVEEEPVVEEQPVVEEPAVEETPVAVVEEVEEEDEDADEEEEEEEEEVSIKSIRPRYDYTTKMKLASDDLKAFYSEIKNEFYSYGIKSRISKAKENFNKGREMIARFVINGKSLKLYMALDPTLLDQKYFHHKDMSEKKAVAEIPTMLLIRSKQSVSRAKELIAMLAEKVELAKKPRYKEKDFSEDLSAEGLTLTQRKGYGYLIRNEIKLEDVELMTDEFAEVLADVSTDESKSMRFIKTTVTLAEIAEHFEDEDIVTIDTIRECGIGAQNANYLIVEESEKLNKKLKVYVDEITPNALKMIALAGGEVYKIWRKM
ncbi:MAG: uL15 family ribosomal protein, partial [Clostridia bacterium]|nr:uL15 family ribosomal protein [Clostridia bacterium]